MITLRPRQEQFVERSIAALNVHQNTLGVAPTGAGKTVILSGVIQRWQEHNPGGKACVLAHRDELVTQNQRTFRRLNPQLTTSVFDSNNKSWAGQTTFAMVPTLCRKSNLKQCPVIDFLGIDEAHHAVANSYRRIIDHVRQLNPDVWVYGVTATPGRGDRRSLRPIFSNVADQVTLAELIAVGDLVPPRTLVIDVGTQDALKRVDQTLDDFDMSAVAAIMDKQVINEAVVQHWKEHAGDRKTIVFCSTVEHAQHVCEAYIKAGIKAAVIHGDLSKTERKHLIQDFDQRDLQVLLNCFVLTEGFDSQPVSCVVLLRPNSQKATYIQCIGRGLRVVDPQEYPDVIKTDCVVLDFGISTHIHQSLEQDIDLDGGCLSGSGDAPQKSCPDCEASVPLGTRVCLLCGYEWSRQEKNADAVLSDFTMSEVDLLKQSHFQWHDLYGDDTAWIATGFDAWVGLFFLDDVWYAMGGTKKSPPYLLMRGGRKECIDVADHWLINREKRDALSKSRLWMTQAATPQQLKYLPAQYRQDYGLNRYQASCLLVFQFNKRVIRERIFQEAGIREVA